MAFFEGRLGLRAALSPFFTGGTAARYTARDVRSLLGLPQSTLDARREAVLQVAAFPSSWTGRLDKQRAWELGRLADRLPTIVSRYAAGTPLDEIGRTERCLATSTVERALDAACACIAAQLNARPTADARLTARG